MTAGMTSFLVPRKAQTTRRGRRSRPRARVRRAQRATRARAGAGPAREGVRPAALVGAPSRSRPESRSAEATSSRHSCPARGRAPLLAGATRPSWPRKVDVASARLTSLTPVATARRWTHRGGDQRRRRNIRLTPGPCRRPQPPESVLGSMELPECLDVARELVAPTSGLGSRYEEAAARNDVAFSLYTAGDSSSCGRGRAGHRARRDRWARRAATRSRTRWDPRGHQALQR